MFRLRLFFAWLLMAAVPLQGFAAASMLMCGMAAQQAPAYAIRHVQQDTDVHAAHAVAAHQDHSAHHHAAPLHHGEKKAGSAHAHSDASHKCNLCAACCHSAAIVQAVLAIALAPAPQSGWAEPLVRIAPIELPVPDKPPRA
jgi:hypothetical protein